MRVLCVGVRYPPHHTGGYELHCRSVVDDLRTHGHDVAVLTSTLRHPGVSDPVEPGVYRALHAFAPAERRLASQGSTPNGTQRAGLGASAPGWREAGAGERHNVAVLRGAIAHHRPDVICWWRLGELSVSLVEHVRRAGLPAVGVVCDPWLVEGPARDPWQRPWVGHPGAAAVLERLVGMSIRVDWSGAARWLFVSEWLRRRTLLAGPPLARTGIAHAGIDLERLPFRAPPSSWRGRLLYAGRLSPLKGVEDAVAALADTAGTLTLHGPGSTEDRERVRAVARGAGVEERVLLAGTRAPEEMGAAYAAHDALLFPARWGEPWGLVPLEAMAVGLPVITTATGGSAEYVRPGANALRVAPGDPAGLAAAVRRLADSPALRAHLATQGRATAQRYPVAACNAVVREALESELEQRGRSDALSKPSGRATAPSGAPH